MAAAQPSTRTWFVELVPETRIRCSYRRAGKRIIRYTVQLETVHGKSWTPIVRYDNAHGFCHRDTIHADGSQDKTAIFVGTANDTFTMAIDELRSNWEAHRHRFLGESST